MPLRRGHRSPRAAGDRHRVHPTGRRDAGAGPPAGAATGAALPLRRHPAQRRGGLRHRPRRRRGGCRAAPRGGAGLRRGAGPEAGAGAGGHPALHHRGRRPALRRGPGHRAGGGGGARRHGGLPRGAGRLPRQATTGRVGPTRGPSRVRVDPRPPSRGRRFSFGRPGHVVSGSATARTLRGRPVGRGQPPGAVAIRAGRRAHRPSKSARAARSVPRCGVHVATARDLATPRTGRSRSWSCCTPR